MKTYGSKKRAPSLNRYGVATAGSQEDCLDSERAVKLEDKIHEVFK